MSDNTPRPEGDPTPRPEGDNTPRPEGDPNTTQPLPDEAQTAPTEEVAQVAPTQEWAQAAASPEVATTQAAAGRPSAWSRVWGSTGGKVGVITAGAVGLLLLGGVAGGAAFAGMRHERMGEGRQVCVSQSGQHAGMGCDRQGMNGQGHRWEGRERGGAGQPGGNQAPGNQAPGSGSGAQGGGMGGLGLAGALHGEVTIRGLDGTPTAMLFQIGEVTSYTPGSKLGVRSSDGFEASYTVSDATVTNAQIAQGSTVRVLATKDGAKASRVQVIGAPISQ